MRILVAPDKFRGTLTAAEAAQAVARGWRRSRPSDEVERVPLADGGEGTLDVLVDAFGGERHIERVTGPLGDPVDADWGLIPRDGGPLAIVEMSRASGLRLLAGRRRDVRRATTRGTGELLRAACRESGEVLVCIGGSATNDGGAGMAQALGIRLLDDAGDDLGPGGEALLELASIDAGALESAARRATFLVACDVDNPLTGPEGAAAVYGPQKGATRRTFACWTGRSAGWPRSSCATSASTSARCRGPARPEGSARGSWPSSARGSVRAWRSSWRPSGSRSGSPAPTS